MADERTPEEKCMIYLKQLMMPKQETKIEIKLYVSHIPADWEDPQVTEYFSKYLEVLDAKVIKDKTLGTHKGFILYRKCIYTLCLTCPGRKIY
jgi:hypothetical protein